jgi:hypothetical protein
MPRLWAILFGTLAIPQIASAQTPDWRFHWQKGSVLNYRVEHQTKVTEIVGGNKSESTSRLSLIKRWQVEAVDGKGTAVVSLSIVAMRNEQIRPNGETLLFDSTALDKSTAGLREKMSKFVGQIVAVLSVDNMGRVLEVKQGNGNRFDVDPPVVLLMPPSPPATGQAWERDYVISLEPPLGTGEKIPAKQRYTCTKIDGSLATIGLATTLLKMPENKMSLLPLVQKLPQGEVIFDLVHGRLKSANLAIDKTVEGHEGEGSSYRYQSVYAEQYMEQ